MPIAAKILTELLPLSVEVFLGNASPGRVLTGLTLFNLANTCIVAGGLHSKAGTLPRSALASHGVPGLAARLPFHSTLGLWLGYLAPVRRDVNKAAIRRTAGRNQKALSGLHVDLQKRFRTPMLTRRLTANPLKRS